MMSIFYEMKFALRSVIKSFGFTLLSVSMLGFGLGATIFMFTACGNLAGLGNVVQNVERFAGLQEVQGSAEAEARRRQSC